MRLAASFTILLVLAALVVTAAEDTTEKVDREAQAKDILESEDRIVVVGDLHGDLYDALVNLRGAGIIHHRIGYYNDALKVLPKDKDETVEEVKKKLNINQNMIFNKRAYLMSGYTPDEYHWCAGRATAIFTGDALDVGPDGINILRLIMRIQKEAVEAGGRVEFLLGNHELQNLNGDFKGVHPQSLEQSGGIEGRKFLLSTRTELGRWLRSSKAVLLHKKKMYMHGGFFVKTYDTIKSILGPQFNRDTFVDELNNAVKRCFWYDGTKDYVVAAPGTPGPPKPNSRTRALGNIVLNADYKTNGDISPELIHPLDKCDEMKKVMEGPLKGIADIQVVGHTPHKIGESYVYCDGLLYAVDFGNSRWKTGTKALVAAMQMVQTRDDHPSRSDIEHEVSKLKAPDSKEAALSIVAKQDTTQGSRAYTNSKTLGQGVVVSLMITTPPSKDGADDNDTKEKDSSVGAELNTYRLAVVLLAVLAAIMAFMLYRNAAPLVKGGGGGPTSGASMNPSTAGGGGGGYGGTSERKGHSGI